MRGWAWYAILLWLEKQIRWSDHLEASMINIVTSIHSKHCDTHGEYHKGGDESKDAWLMLWDG